MPDLTNTALALFIVSGLAVAVAIVYGLLLTWARWHVRRKVNKAGVSASASTFAPTPAQVPDWDWPPRWRPPEQASSPDAGHQEGSSPDRGRA